MTVRTPLRLFLGAALLLAACTYRVAVRPAPSNRAYAFEDRLPARAAVHVDAEQLFRTVSVLPAQDGHCADTKYPVDARDALGQSVVGTLEPLVAEVRWSESRVRRSDLEPMGLDAVIAVRADVFDVAIVSTGFFGTGMEATAAVSLAVSVFTEEGLRFREIVAGNAVQSDSVLTCGDGAGLLGGAIEIAIENAMTDLGELIVNAPDLRDSLSP